MKKWMNLKQMLFINELIKNENQASQDYLKNLFSREDYRNLLENSLTLLKTNPNSFLVTYRSGLYKLSELDNKIKTVIDKKRLAPGIVLDYGTLQNQEVVFHGNRQEVEEINGVLKDKIVPMDFYTIFDLASTSKLFTAISILQLVQLGLVDLEAPISEYTDCFPLINDVKIIDLLTFNVPVKTDERIDKAPSKEEAEKILFRIHQYDYNAPFVYTDMGCLVLKYIIENITGISLKEYITNHILQPSNMFNTYLNVPEDYKSIVANENYASFVDEKGSIRTLNNIVPGEVHDAKARALGHKDGNASGHAGWFSNALDMSLLATSLLNNVILKQEYVLMLGQYNQNANPFTNSENPKWKSHHGILTFLKQPNTDYLHVQPFLSGNAFISPGFAGTTFCLDPLNKIYAFSAANRLHNRIYSIPEAYRNNIYENELGEKIYRDDVTQKTISSSYTKESEDIIKEAMKIALQIKLIEKIEGEKKQMKLVREI